MLEQPRIRPIDDSRWKLEDPIRWARFVIPRGFVTDLASVPRFFWRVIPPFGLHTTPAIIHDYLYARQPDAVTRKEADQQFLRAMQAYGVPSIRANVMYRAVRLGGWRGWNKHRNQ